MRKTSIKLEDITLYDLLTVDTHGEKISIEAKTENKSYDLIPSREIFFSKDGLFADVEKNGIALLGDGSHHTNLDDLLKKWENSRGSSVVLIEGYAGCGKSTLVQYILLKQLKTFEYD